MAADPTYGPKIHGAGPDKLVVEVGGEIEVLGTLTVGGVTVDENTLAMTDLTASAAELNVLDGATAGAAVASKGVVLDSSKRFAGMLTPLTARTATADGTGTGTIADGGGFDEHVTVTAGGDANAIIILPTPVVGKKITLHVGATGFELRSNDPATVAINGGSGAAAESAIPANSTVFLVCVTATAWKGFYLDADSDLAKVEAAAA